MILDEIVAFKRQLLRQPKPGIEKLEQIIEQLPPARDFLRAISKTDGKLKLIAEVKRASPLKGVLAVDFCPHDMAESYTGGGAAAISVLTETNFFLGSINDLKVVRSASHLPILRKDFVIDSYQIIESRAIGADAVLLIAAILRTTALEELIKLALGLGLCPLVEVHNSQELKKALTAGANVIGINNRNLTNFKVDLATTFTLLSLIPSGKIVISESGINAANIGELKKSRVDGILVGETLVTSNDRKEAVRGLLA